MVSVTIKLVVSKNLADELQQWVQDEITRWPEETAYQHDLADLARQLDAVLPTAADVRGIMAKPEPTS